MSGSAELSILPDLTPREAAHRLGTSVATVWAMIADGRLVSYRLSSKPGSARRIRHEAVEAIRRGIDPIEAVRAADQVTDDLANVPRRIDRKREMEKLTD